jgi:hypothetical protein
MKFSALHAASGLTLTMKVPQTGQQINLTFPRGVDKIPVHGTFADRNFEGYFELVPRETKTEGDDVDRVVIFTAPAVRVTAQVEQSKVKPTGTRTDPAAHAPSERGRSGIAPTTIALSPGNSDMEMAPVATQDFDKDPPKKVLNVQEGVFGVNPFAPPSAFVTAAEGFKGLELGGMERPDSSDGPNDMVVPVAVVAQEDAEVPPHIQAALDAELPAPPSKGSGSTQKQAGKGKEESKKGNR